MDLFKLTIDQLETQCTKWRKQNAEAVKNIKIKYKDIIDQQSICNFDQELSVLYAKQKDMLERQLRQGIQSRDYSHFKNDAQQQLGAIDKKIQEIRLQYGLKKTRDVSPIQNDSIALFKESKLTLNESFLIKFYEKGPEDTQRLKQLSEKKMVKIPQKNLVRVRSEEMEVKFEQNMRTKVISAFARRIQRCVRRFLFVRTLAKRAAVRKIQRQYRSYLLCAIINDRIATKQAAAHRIQSFFKDKKRQRQIEKLISVKDGCLVLNRWSLKKYFYLLIDKMRKISKVRAKLEKKYQAKCLEGRYKFHVYIGKNQHLLRHVLEEEGKYKMAAVFYDKKLMLKSYFYLLQNGCRKGDNI